MVAVTVETDATVPLDKVTALFARVNAPGVMVTGKELAVKTGLVEVAQTYFEPVTVAETVLKVTDPGVPESAVAAGATPEETKPAAPLGLV